MSPSTESPRVGRRRGSAGPLVVFLVLLGGAIVFREPLLAPLRGPGVEERGQAGAADGAPGEVGSEVLSGGEAEPVAVPEPVAVAVAVAEPEPEAVAEPEPVAEPAPAPDTNPAPTPNPTHQGRTRTGLRKFTLDTSAPVGTSILTKASDSDAATSTGHSASAAPVDPVVRAFERAPADPAALQALVDSLLEENLSDEALETVIRFAEAGGSPEVADDWRTQLDPFAHERATLLLEAAQGLLELAARCDAKQLWIMEAALLEGTTRLARTAAVELNSSQQAPFDALLETVAAKRDALHRRREAVKQLAVFGAPLPADVDVRSSLKRRATATRDARNEEKGRLSEATTRHVHVITPLGSLVAERAADVIEAVYDALVDRFDADPWRSRSTLTVELLDAESTYAARRQAAEPARPEWMDAFLDGDRRLIALDPRRRGAPLEELWGYLARETARRFLLDLSKDDAHRALPTWLREAHVVGYEGTRLLADGSIALDGLPTTRLREMDAALSGQGARPVPLGSVLLQVSGERDPPTWAWSLARYLAEARDPEGELVWAEHFDALLVAPGVDDPVRAFEAALFEGAKGPPEGLVNPGALEGAWLSWARHEAAIDRGEDEAVRDALADARGAVGRRDWDGARAILRRLRGARADHPDVLKLTVDVAERTGHADEAMLAAWHLAALRTPAWDWTPSGGTEPLPEQLASQSARVRFAEAVEVHEATGEALAEHDESVRRAVLSLVDRMLAEKYPRAALRLIDGVLGVQPLDAGFLAMRASILADVLGMDDLLVHRRLDVDVRLAGLSGDRDLFQPHVDGSRIEVRAADRVAPATLRGLVELAPPYRVSLRLEFQEDVTGRISDDGTRFAGLLFGAADAAGHGDWGVFATPAGSVELATSGRLEWPSRSVGRGIRGALDLEVRVEGRRLEIRSGTRSLRVLELGERTAPGWLGLFVRHADVDLVGLVVSRSRRPDPRAQWWTSGGR